MICRALRHSPLPHVLALVLAEAVDVGGFERERIMIRVMLFSDRCGG
jgi:hypothetical protein